MQKKQVIRIGIAGAATAVVLGAAAFYFTHSFIDGEVFPKNAPVLDLTDHTLSIQQYTDICSRYPDSQVLWTVPFQGNRYPEDTESITIISLTEDEARELCRLLEKNLDRTKETGAWTREDLEAALGKYGGLLDA